MNEEPVNLVNLADGAALELFQRELEKVLENILDINTVPDATRSVTLTVKLLPDEDRNVSDVEIQATSKLAPDKAAVTRFYIGKREGQAIAVEANPRQKGLFDDPSLSGGPRIVDFQTGEVKGES